MKKTLAFLIALMLGLGATVGALAEITYPISDEKIELTVWGVNTLSDYVVDLNETPFYQALEEATGVHVNFIHPNSSNLQEQFNLLMFADKLPDIIYGGNLYTGGPFQGVADNVFVNLADYLPEYAPDYWKIITANDNIYREASNAEGVIAIFGRMKLAMDPPFHRMVLKQEMLDELGIEIPQTIDEVEVMFAKMLEKGITPFMIAKNGLEANLMGVYDVVNGFQKDENGKVSWGMIAPGFKDYLTLMHKWYDLGYISKDFANQANTNTMFDNGEIGTYYNAIVATYNRGQRYGATIVAAPYLRLNDTQKLHWEDTQYGNFIYNSESDYVVITTSCENIEAACKWMNYRYTQEGADLCNWGVEGLNYNVVDGQKVYNDLMLKNEKFTPEQASYYYKMHLGAKLAEPDVVCHANLLASEGARASRMRWADCDYIDKEYVLPPLSYTSEQNARRTEIMTEINTYMNEMVLKFIIGTESLDNYDAYVENVKKMGIDEAIQIVQDAYDAYMAITMK